MKPVIVIIAFVAGCGTEDLPSESRELCTERPIGDPQQPIELSLVARDRNGGVHDITAQKPESITLSTGDVGLALSIRARNLDGCAINVAMRSGEIRGGTLVQLDTSGHIDPADALQFVELPGATATDPIDAAAQDAQGRWTTVSYRP